MMERFLEYLSLIRVRHWIKNLFLLSPIIFSRNFFDPSMLVLVAYGIAVFCLLSSAIYVINDIKDVEEDKKHPIKKNRMLPSGRISIKVAWKVFWALSVVSLVAASLINRDFAIISVGYYLLNIAYTYYLKDKVILDVFTIAAGFLIRVVAGGFVIGVIPSTWLLLCTFLLSLFLGFCKRRHELVMLETNAHNHREVLGLYTPYLLDQMIAVVSATTVISYLMYTMSLSTTKQFGEDLVYTFPYVLYGIFRYLYLVHRRDKGGSPTDTLLMDPPLLLNIYLWFITVVVIIY